MEWEDRTIRSRNERSRRIEAGSSLPPESRTAHGDFRGEDGIEGESPRLGPRYFTTRSGHAISASPARIRQK